MVEIGSGAEKNIETAYLSRYACYLIVQNSDPAKLAVCFRSDLFLVIQTRETGKVDNLVRQSIVF